MIPDELYDPAMDPPDGLDVQQLFALSPPIAELLGDIDTDFLDHLQSTHDSNGTPETMEQALLHFAATHNLEVPS